MAGLIAVVILLFLFILAGLKRKAAVKRAPLQRKGGPPAATATPPPPDDALIDVTGTGEKINRTLLNDLGNPKPVPPWPQVHITSHNELQHATREQRSFYFYFRNAFFQKVRIDLQGNNNYAWILLFDLFQEYDSHKDIDRLKKEVGRITQYYPFTGGLAAKQFITRVDARRR